MDDNTRDEASAAPAQVLGEATDVAECARCGKPVALCVCDGVTALETTIELLILQHPQEQDRWLGTARLTALHVKRATLKIGLSWPSLSRILGRTVDPQRWAVLYLGSLKASDIVAQSSAPKADVIVVNKKGEPEPKQAAILRGLEGVILLDGTWSQAKALWWRNAWMLKCRRVILNPKAASRYGRLRREPRADGLSTLEAAGMLMSRLEQRGEVEAALLASFDRLLNLYRQLQKTAPGFDRSHEPSKGGRFRGAQRQRRRFGRT